MAKGKSPQKNVKKVKNEFKKPRVKTEYQRERDAAKRRRKGGGNEAFG